MAEVRFLNDAFVDRERHLGYNILHSEQTAGIEGKYD